MASRHGVDRPMERSSRPVVGYGGTVSFRDNVCIGNWVEDRAAHAHASEVFGDSSSLATGGPFLGESTTQNHFSNSGKTGSDLLHASRRFDLKPRGNNAPRGRRFLIDHGSNNDSSNSGRVSLTQAAHSDPRSMHELMTSYPHKGTKAGTQQPVQVASLSASQSLRRTSLHSSREASAEARERRADFSSHAAAMQGSVTEAEHAKTAILAARERPKADSKAPEMPEKRPHGPNSKGTTKSTAQTMGLRAERKTR